MRQAWIADRPQKLTRPEIRRMKKLWAKIPAVKCKGLCQAACTNVPLPPVEAYYLIEKHNAILTPAFHPGNHCLPTLGANGPCEFLKDGRCSIYEDRPLICRGFGHNILTLSCSHNCKAEHPISELQFGNLLLEMAATLSDCKLPTNASPTEMFDYLKEQVDDMVVLMETDE